MTCAKHRQAIDSHSSQPLSPQATCRHTNLLCDRPPAVKSVHLLIQSLNTNRQQDREVIPNALPLQLDPSQNKKTAHGHNIRPTLTDCHGIILPIRSRGVDVISAREQMSQQNRRKIKMESSTDCAHALKRNLQLRPFVINASKEKCHAKGTCLVKNKNKKLTK